MKIVKIYLLLLLALGGLIVLPSMAMQESPIVVEEQLCYRCGDIPGIKSYGILYRCKTPHSEKLCQNCYNFLTESSKKGKNPAKCPVCAMNSWQLPDNTPHSPIKLTAKEFNFIYGTSGLYFDEESSEGSASKTFARPQEMSRSFKTISLCIAAITVGLGKYVWHKIKSSKKTLPTEQIPNIPDTTTSNSNR